MMDPAEKAEFINAGGLKALAALADRFLKSAPAANSLKDWSGNMAFVHLALKFETIEYVTMNLSQNGDGKV